MQLFRVSGILELEKIQKAKVLFLGLGSLGSLAIANLAFPFSQIVLVDPDDLEDANVERHLLGMDWIGKPKVNGVKDWLLQRGLRPENILIHQGRAEEVLEQHADADLVIVSIDKRRSRKNINAFCHSNNIQALYGGVYPNGTAGQVVVVPKPQDACFVCAEFRMGIKNDTQDHPLAHDYGIDPTTLSDEDGELRAVPALRASISSIADNLAHFALQLLGGKDVESQVHVQSFGHWESILTLDPGHTLDLVGYFTEYLPNLGLVPHFTLEPMEGGEAFTLNIRHTGLSLQLKQWKSCPLHSRAVSMDDI